MNTNPFSLPNFNALGDTASNPLLRSMDMMSQAWKNMATGGSGDISAAMAAQLDPTDLERRIRDLRAVESWLQLNLSMLSATIQGMEIQRSTLDTLHSLAQATGQANPFEALMAVKPTSSEQAPKPAASTKTAQAEPKQATKAAQDKEASHTQTVSDGMADAMAEAGAAAQGWWNMLQQQFESLASASLQHADAFRPAPAQAASADSTLGPRISPFQARSEDTAQTAASPSKPSTTSTSTPRKVSQKTAVKKAAVKKTAAKKVATKARAKTASKKVAAKRSTSTGK